MENIIIVLIVLLELWALYNNSGLRIRKYNFGFMGYYTTLSNIMVFLYFLLLLITFGKDNWLRKGNVAMDVALTITMTFLIYHFVLSPSINQRHKEGVLDWNPVTLTNYSLHYICPLLTDLWFFCFVDKSSLTWIDGIKWLLIPVLYIIYTFIRVKLKIKIRETGSMYYPYDFMDVDAHGAKRVAINMAVLTVLFGLLGEVFVFIGKLL